MSIAFIVIFKQGKNYSEKERKHERTGHVMCSLLHRKIKEKKADKRSSQQS